MDYRGNRIANCYWQYFILLIIQPIKTYLFENILSSGVDPGISKSGAPIKVLPLSWYPAGGIECHVIYRRQDVQFSGNILHAYAVYIV